MIVTLLIIIKHEKSVFIRISYIVIITYDFEDLLLFVVVLLFGRFI